MVCHICSNETESFTDGKTGIQYFNCKSCEFIFKSPEYYQGIKEQKSRYDLHENDENNPGYRAYFQRFLDYVLPLTGTPKNALDFGCGRSLLLAKMLEEKGVICDAYDPLYHPDTLDNSKKYELIVTTEVFEHLHHPKEIFYSLVERLEEGGFLAIQTQFSPQDREAFKMWYYHQDPTHIVFFSPRTFRVLCEMYGCEWIGDNGTNMVVLQKVP